jgi:hypothetical protein
MITVSPSSTIGQRLFQFSFGDWLSEITLLKFDFFGLLPQFLSKYLPSTNIRKSVYGGFTEIDGDWPRIMRTNLPIHHFEQFKQLYGHLHLKGTFRRVEFTERTTTMLRNYSRASYEKHQPPKIKGADLVVSLHHYYSYRPKANASDLPVEVAQNDPARVIRETMDYRPILAAEVPILLELIKRNCTKMSKVLILCDQLSLPDIHTFSSLGCTLYPCDDIERFHILTHANRIISLMSETDWWALTANIRGSGVVLRHPNLIFDCRPCTINSYHRLGIPRMPLPSQYEDIAI